jgi:uncharacterized protein
VQKGFAMKVAVLGSTGRTGKRVVQHALDRGHHVQALARRPETVTLVHPYLIVVQADAHDAEALDATLAGCDAIVSALGFRQCAATAVWSGREDAKWTA